jgi:hypothetical protein
MIAMTIAMSALIVRRPSIIAIAIISKGYRVNASFKKIGMSDILRPMISSVIE